jgi:prepilin-type N-terminal cleavage/methylation domain-containing protein
MRRGFTLVEMVTALALMGIVALALSALWFSGVQSQREAESLQAQSLVSDLRDQILGHIRSISDFGVTNPQPSGFRTEIAQGGARGCLEYRILDGHLEQRSWSGSCNAPSGGFQEVLTPGLLPLASFCYDDPSHPSLIALMDSPCDLENPANQGLSLQLNGRSYRFPPLVGAIRSQ